MQFYENQLFHIYNQGNNQRQVFFSEDNYELFIWKMRAYLLPFGDLIAWCLMSNHFHWLLYVRQVQIVRQDFFEKVDAVEWKRRVSKYGKKARPVERDWMRRKNTSSLITLNEAIGILQRSYGRSINKSKGWSGRLFRDNCQAKDGWISDFVTLTKNGKEDSRFFPGNEYGYYCLNYIHQNPVDARMVKNAFDYNWSSAKDYAGLRKGSLCNLSIGKDLKGFR